MKKSQIFELMDHMLELVNDGKSICLNAYPFDLMMVVKRNLWRGRYSISVLCKFSYLTYINVHLNTGNQF